MSRGNPEPWPRKVRGGKICWYVTVGGKQKRLGFDRDEAFRRWHEMLSRPLAEVPLPPGGEASVRDVCNYLLAWVSRHRARRTLDWYRDLLRSFCRSLQDDPPAASVRPYHAEAWLAANPGWGPSYRRSAVVAVKAAFKKARRHGLIERDPLENYQTPAAIRREVVLSDADYATFLRLCPLAFRDVAAFVWATGARPQEVCRLRIEHLNRASDTAILPKELAKGGKRPRVIRLSEAGLEIVLRNVHGRTQGPLFRNSKGNAWNRHSVSCALRRVQLAWGREILTAESWHPTPTETQDLATDTGWSLRRARPECYRREARRRVRKYCLYHLRHSWVDRLLKAGASVAAVAHLAGHRSPRMVLEVYQHLDQDSEYLRQELKRLA